MRSLLFAAIVAALLAGSVNAQNSDPGWKTSKEGQLILRPFASAPYPHASRENGFKGRTTTYPADPHYADSTIGIFIPASYQPDDSVDFVVHFHGHNNHVAKVIEQYRLPEQLAASRVNAILIVPQGPKDAADSGGGKLEVDQGAFARMIDDVTRFLLEQHKIRSARIGRIVLTSHSGGYKVTGAVLDHGGLADHITDVLLLDSSYGSLEQFAKWCAASPKHRLVSLFTTHLAEANKELMTLLDKSSVKHQEFEESMLTQDVLAQRGPLFISTQVPHDRIPNEYFGWLVSTSALQAPAQSTSDRQ